MQPSTSSCQSLAHKGGRFRTLLPIEWVTLGYLVFTLVLIGLWHADMASPLRLAGERVVIVAVMAVLLTAYRYRPGSVTLFLRQLFPLALLGYWYPDTYEFCQLLPNLDHVFAAADQTLFGCQPSLEFSAAMPQKVWSELFHLGYFSYYFLIVITVLSPLWACPQRFQRTAFVVLTGFMLYYTVYLFLPVAGPQYYFRAISPESVADGVFPHLNYYFRTHTELRPSPGPEGFFRALVETTQQSGERPTAAFPSSHVGMSTVLMLCILKNSRTDRTHTLRPLLLLCLPLYVLLCASTVYIEAHYLIDAIAGLFTGILVYSFCRWAFSRLDVYGGCLEKPSHTTIM